MMQGAKGGGGGSNSFTQRPDTLRSNDTFEGLIGLCAGPIKGPVRGLKSIRLNDTPIEDESGAENFPGFTAIFADGDPLKYPQVATLRLGSGGAPTNIGAAITNTSGGPGPWITRSLPNTGAEAIDLRFVVQQLYRQDKQGIYEHTLNLEIEMKPSGTATWINPFAPNGNPLVTYDENGYALEAFKLFITAWTHHQFTERYQSGGTQYLTITGKTSSPYVHELRVQVPNTGVYANKGWDIRVRLIERDTVDADPVFEKRIVGWESMAAVYGAKLGDNEEWRGLAWLQVFGKAGENFSGDPSIDGIYDLKIVSVPAANVYNPETRAYTGQTWDGSWAKSFTRDPAWIINDAISDSISGIAAFVPGARLNKWDALDLSKWASQLVPDGKGGQHPRYSMDLLVDQPQKADEFIRYMAGAVASTAWDNGDGEWRLKVDKPQAPAAVFTHENIEGEFVWSHTDVDTRFNDITVVFLNEEFDYREDRVRVRDQADINKNGRKPTKVVAIGCTNRQQALRLAVLRLRTSLNEFRLCNFTTNRQGKMLERFDHILVADGTLAGIAVNSTGRIIARSGTQVTVRDPLRLEVGASYKLHVTIPNPNYAPNPTSEPTSPTWNQPTVTITRNIVNTAAQRGDVTVLHLDQSLPASVAENANVALEAVGLPTLPKVLRVLDVDYVDDGERVSINAIEVDTGKWAASDNANEDELNIAPPQLVVPAPGAPGDGQIVRLVVNTSAEPARITLQANWERPAARYFDRYGMSWSFNGGPLSPELSTRERQFEIENPRAGTYRFEIRAYDRRGVSSLPLVGELEVTEEELGDLAEIIADLEELRDTVDDIASDGVLLPGAEKQKTRLDWKLVNETVGAIQTRWQALGSPTDIQATVDLAVQRRNQLEIYLTEIGLFNEERSELDKPTYELRWNNAITAMAAAQVAIQGRQGPKGADGLPGVPGSNGQTWYTYYAYANSPDGFVDFTTGEPGTRTYVGFGTGTAASEPTSPSLYSWSAYRGPPFGLATRGNAVVAGNQVIKNGGANAWDSDAYSTVGYRDGAVASFNPATSSEVLMVGLNTDPLAGTGWETIDHAWHLTASGEVQIYENGVLIQTAFVGYDASNNFRVDYDGRWVRYFVGSNGPYRSVDVGSGKTFYFDSSFHRPGTRATNIGFTSAGKAGADAPFLKLDATTTFAKLAADGNYVGGQTITFTATRINIGEQPTWQILSAGGSVLFAGTAAQFVAAGAGHWTTTGVDNLTLTPAGLAANMDAYGGTQGRFSVRVNAGGQSATSPVQKLQDGTNGAPGSSNGEVRIYRRSTTQPSLPNAPVTYTFGSGAISGLTNGWSATPQAGSEQQWVSVAVASSNGGSDTIAPNEWATPVQDGATLNSRAVFAYQRSVNQPAQPTQNSTFTFSTQVLANLSSGWQSTIPVGTEPLWVITAAALSPSDVDNINPGEWATARLLAQNGVSAKSIKLLASREQITQNATGALNPAGSVQDVTFTVQKQNTNATVFWYINRSQNGNAYTTGDSWAVGAQALVNIMGAAKSLVVEVQVTDGAEVFIDRVTISRVQDGANGSNGSSGGGGGTSGTIPVVSGGQSALFVDAIGMAGNVRFDGYIDYFSNSFSPVSIVIDRIDPVNGSATIVNQQIPAHAVGEPATYYLSLIVNTGLPGGTIRPWQFAARLVGATGDGTIAFIMIG